MFLAFTLYMPFYLILLSYKTKKAKLCLNKYTTALF